MSAERKQDIAARYQWLVDLLEKEFPGKIRIKTGDYGCECAIAIVSKTPHAFYVEWAFYPGRVAYALNDDPQRDEKVAEIIAKFKEHDQ